MTDLHSDLPTLPGNSRVKRFLGGSPVLPLALLLVFIAVVVGGWNYQAGKVAQADVKQQRALVERSDDLVSTMKDLEIGERGYALTGRADYLEPYDAALPRIDRELDDLDALTAGSRTTAAEALRPLRDLVSKERAFFARVVAARREQGSDAATTLVSTGVGKQLMDTIVGAKRDADNHAEVETARIEDADSLRARVLGLVTLICGGGAVALLVRLSFVRRREGQRSRRTLDDVLDNAPVGLGFLDGTFRLQHMNRAFAEMGRHGLQAGVGGPLWGRHAELEQTIRPALVAARDRSRARIDLDVQLPDAEASGTRHLRMGFYPLQRWDQGEANAGVGVAVIDLTEAKASEERIRAGEAVLRAVLDTLPVGVLIAAAPSGRITGYNARVEAILGHGVLPARPGEDVARWVGFHEDGRSVAPDEWPLIRVIRHDEPSAELEVDYQRGDGRRSWIAFAGAPMKDLAGRITGGVVVVSDIDARKRSEQSLAAARDAAEAASRAKSTFLANMSHELRTPLSAIIGYSEMLQEEIADREEASDLSPDMGRIESNARHLLGLINDVLDLSKVESGKMEVYEEIFEVEPMLRELAATVGSLVGKKGNRLELRMENALGSMHTDITKVRQVMLNLIGNAAKFTENGTITLAAGRQAGSEGADRLSFSVSDTGIGMTEDQVAKLFQRFSQADASTTRKFGGSGLGLSLVKAFADMLDGSVSVESTPDQGSAFTFVVPAEYVAKVADEAGTDVVALESAAGLDRDLVLVIDDDADQRTLLSRFLEREGFAVDVAADGRQGLAMVRALHPRAILLDVMMPGIDGWSVLSALKADPTMAGIPVVMVTSVDEKNLATSLGAADYMLKPVRWDRFSQVMNRFRTREGGLLLVDDDAELRLHLRSLLERNDWAVTEAGNGQEALHQIAVQRPEAILLDLNMPVMDGFAFLKAVRDVPGCADIPVVILTARDLTRGDRDLLRGASQILNKGDVSLGNLAARLRSLAPGKVSAHARP